MADRRNVGQMPANDQQKSHFSKEHIMKTRSERMRRSTRAAMIAVALSISACVVNYTDVPYSAEQLQRRVVDARTGEGIADAMVVFLWDRNETDFGHASRTTCYRVEMTRTDSQGRYALPSWNGRMPMIASIFKKGLVEDSDPIALSKGLHGMKKGSADTSKRIEELGRALVQCNDTEDKKLLGLYEAIYDDGRSVAKSPQEKRLVDRYFLSPLDTVRYGGDEARRRAHQREIER